MKEAFFKEFTMKKRFFFLIVALLALIGGFSTLTEFSEKNFRRFMELEWAREVFDLDEEEAAAVFGDEGEAIFL